MKENNILKYAIKYWVLSLIVKLENQVKRLDNNECTNEEMIEASKLIKENLYADVSNKYNDKKGEIVGKKNIACFQKLFSIFFK